MDDAVTTLRTQILPHPLRIGNGRLGRAQAESVNGSRHPSSQTRSPRTSEMSRARQSLSKLLYKQHVDMVEYVLLLSLLICSAVATGVTLTHQINNEFNQITSRF